MELVSLAKEVAQSLAEQAASYRVGQAALRHLDRALWVVEKCARWAVPPPLDADERPQPELVRPLPWVFFLSLLVALRITRESISLVYLVLGKPPLRSADVVMYIQSKRRYLRTLKYQGNRNLRARTSSPYEPWYGGLRSLFEFTMCFRRSYSYDNNNTTSVSRNEQVLVVKRSKRGREPPSPAVAASSENTMERLIEKMMVDLDADSEDDSSFTLTNATSHRSDQSDIDTNDDAIHTQNETIDTQNETIDTTITSDNSRDDITVNNGEPETNATPEKFSPPKNFKGSTPEKNNHNEKTEPEKPSEVVTSSPKENIENVAPVNNATAPVNNATIPKAEQSDNKDTGAKNKSELSQPYIDTKSVTPERSLSPKNRSPKEDTNKFLQGERCSPKAQVPSKNLKIGKIMSKFFSPKKEKVEIMANGRVNQTYKKKGLQRRDPEETAHFDEGI